MVCVDEMKLAGPTKHMEATWKALGKNIKLEIPKGDVTGNAKGTVSANGDTKATGHDETGKEVLSKMTFLGCTLKRYGREYEDTKI